MSYTIYTPGSSITIPDGTIANTGSTLTLVGKNYAGYGQFLDQNFVNLLTNGVNGGNSNQPSTPLVGQLWWDNTNKVMKVYPAGGSSWKSVGAATASATAPAANVSGTGDLWFDSTNQQLKVYNGNAYSLVGPAYSSGQGVTGAIPVTLTDTSGNTHTALELYSGNVVVGMISADPQYVPLGNISASFPTINPGITVPGNITNATSVTSNSYFWGTATNSLQLGGVNASSYLTNTSSNTANISFSSLGVGANATGVIGEIVAANNITAYYSSDSKFKVNIQDISDATSKAKAIGGKTFEWTDEYLQGHGGEDGYFYPKHDYGVVAQDVQAVFPTAVRTREDGSLAIDYGRLSALALAAIKELAIRVEALEARCKCD